LSTTLRALLALVAGLSGTGGLAHDHAAHGPHAAKTQAVKAASSSVKLLDLELTNQEGKTAKFKNDVIGDRIVVLDNIYTSCTTICPVVTTIMVSVQSKIGVRAGKDVSLVSLSVDPVTDTPARLRAYARRHKAAWDLWTGPKPAMDRVLKGLGIYTPDYIDHPSSILVGDGRTGEWTRFYGFASPEQIVQKVDELLSARQSAAVKQGVSN
jgi:protein SCO1/2